MYRASGQAVPVGTRILDLNPKHPLVTGLQQAHKAGGDSSLTETAELLYGTAVLAEGDIPEDPATFAGLLADRLPHTVKDTPPQPKSRDLLADGRQVSYSSSLSPRGAQQLVVAPRFETIGHPVYRLDTGPLAPGIRSASISRRGLTDRSLGARRELLPPSWHVCPTAGSSF
jgi:hypothetical protein